MYTLDFLSQEKYILFEAISGSKAYGTDLPHSDEDIRGVFIIPHNDLLGMNQTTQVSDEKQDIVFYELKRFLELLATNNPTLLELIHTPIDCIRFQHPLFEIILKEKNNFLTKKCAQTFGGYALQQIKKARGLNKKIVQQFEEERKTPLHFCYVISSTGYGSIPLLQFFKEKKYDQTFAGLAAIPHMRDMYALFYDSTKDSLQYKGIIQSNDSTDVSLSSIPLNEKPIATLYFNKDGYSMYCREYKEYWQWVNERNPDRFAENKLHDKGYDGKNLMHCHRLLDMCIEIGEGKGINVRRPNREQLLAIRRGEYDYDQLIEEAEQKIAQINALFAHSTLPDELDPNWINNLLVLIRKKFYQLI